MVMYKDHHFVAYFLLQFLCERHIEGVLMSYRIVHEKCILGCSTSSRSLHNFPKEKLLWAGWVLLSEMCLSLFSVSLWVYSCVYITEWNKDKGVLRRYCCIMVLRNNSIPATVHSNWKGLISAIMIYFNCIQFNQIPYFLIYFFSLKDPIKQKLHLWLC